MKILHLVTRSEPGGAQSVVRTLASVQAESGDLVTIASGAEGGGEAFLGLDPRIRLVVIPDLRRAIAPLGEVKALIAIAALYRELNPDIVHVHTSKASALGRLAAGWTRTGLLPHRIVYTMHGYDQLRVENRMLLVVDKALRSRCGAIVAVSDRDAAAMRKDGYEVSLVQNGVSEPRIQPPSQISARLDELKARLAALRVNGLPIALMVARDARPKRIDLARDVARIAGRQVQIAWIGGDPRPDDPPGFHALGSCPAASSLYGYADMFLLASDHEGMPLSVLEALAAGLPVIASDVGGVAEILDPGAGSDSICGYALQNEAPRFAEALVALATDPLLRNRLSARARGRWAEMYSSERMAARYNYLYDKLSSV